MHLGKYRWLLLFMVAGLWSSAFSKTILPTYYLSQGLSLVNMIFAIFILFITQLAFLLLVRKARAKILWKISLFTSLLSLLLVIKLHYAWQFYLSYMMSGVSMFSYWTAYNLAYFRETPKEKTGLGSAVMFSVFPLLSIIAPPLAGYVLQIHATAFWLFSIAFFFVAYLFIDRQEDFVIHYSLRSIFSEIRATRVLLFLEGIWEAIVYAIIPIYTLYFISTPLVYGTFAAYLSLFGVFANLLLGTITDKFQKRVLFLYPLTLLMAAVTFLFPIATSSLALWLALTGILNFFVPLFWNISTSMFIDTHPNLASAIPGREIILAAGRTLGVSLVVLSFLAEPQPRVIFYILGCIILLYPLYLFWVSRYKKLYAFR